MSLLKTMNYVISYSEQIKCGCELPRDAQYALSHKSLKNILQLKRILVQLLNKFSFLGIEFCHFSYVITSLRVTFF